MSMSGHTLGIMIASKLIPPTADAGSIASMTDTWIKVGDAICEYLSMQTIMTDIITLAGPGNITLANGGGPCAGAIIMPPLTGKMVLP